MLTFYRNIKKIALKDTKIEKPDIILASSVHLLTCVAGLQTAKKLGVPCVVEIRDLWPESIVEYSDISRKNPVIKALYRMEKWIYKHADRLIFTMEGGAQYIKDKGWDKEIGLDKVYHINNGIDLEEFKRNKEEFKLPDPDLEDDTFKIIYTGSIRKVNNLGFLLDVAKQLSNSNIKFIFYGKGNEEDKLKERIQNEQIDNVIFKGFVNSKYLPYILSKSSISILHNSSTKMMETYGGSQNKLFTYLAAGQPVLSTIKMGYDIISKYNAGISIETQSVETCKDAIIEIYEMDDSKYNMMCENARSAAEHYDYEVLSEKLLKILGVL